MLTPPSSLHAWGLPPPGAGARPPAAPRRWPGGEKRPRQEAAALREALGSGFQSESSGSGLWLLSLSPRQRSEGQSRVLHGEGSSWAPGVLGRVDSRRPVLHSQGLTCGGGGLLCCVRGSPCCPGWRWAAHFQAVPRSASLWHRAGADTVGYSFSSKTPTLLLAQQPASSPLRTAPITCVMEH